DRCPDGPRRNGQRHRPCLADGDGSLRPGRGLRPLPGDLRRRRRRLRHPNGDRGRPRRPRTRPVAPHLGPHPWLHLSDRRTKLRPLRRRTVARLPLDLRGPRTRRRLAPPPRPDDRRPGAAGWALAGRPHPPFGGAGPGGAATRIRV
ncbi:MAG: hypothetical protein AVDCRST_MAG73-2742, partial [uncultured Thermomicrobiales bacterium]